MMRTLTDVLMLNALASLEYNIVLLSSFISTQRERRTNVCHYPDGGQTYIEWYTRVRHRRRAKEKKEGKKNRPLTHSLISSSSSCRQTSRRLELSCLSTMVNYTCGVASTKNSFRRSSSSQLTLLRKQNERFRLRRISEWKWKLVQQSSIKILFVFFVNRYSVSIQWAIKMSGTAYRNSIIHS